MYSMAELYGQRNRLVNETQRPLETHDILILGASYGSLLASKLLFAGHRIHFVCLPKEAELIAAEGFRVRMPVKGREQPLVIDSNDLPGIVSASGPEGVEP